MFNPNVELFQKYVSNIKIEVGLTWEQVKASVYNIAIQTLIPPVIFKKIQELEFETPKEIYEAFETQFKIYNVISLVNDTIDKLNSQLSSYIMEIVTPPTNEDLRNSSGYNF